MATFVAILTDYPEDIGRRVIDPKVGLATTNPYFPKPYDLKQFCEAAFKFEREMDEAEEARVRSFASGREPETAAITWRRPTQEERDRCVAWAETTNGMNNAEMFAYVEEQIKDPVWEREHRALLQLPKFAYLYDMRVPKPKDPSPLPNDGYIGAWGSLATAVRKGPLTAEQAARNLSDPEKLADWKSPVVVGEALSAKLKDMQDPSKLGMESLTPGRPGKKS